MSHHSYQLDFFTIGEHAGLSDDATTRRVHLDVPAEALAVAASLQSARQWLLEQHAGIDMECTAELALRGYFTFQSSEQHQGFHIESAQLVALEDGFVVRAGLENGIYVETDLLQLPL